MQEDVSRAARFRTMPRAMKLLVSEVIHMTETSITLLNRLRQSDDPEMWTQLVGLYGPLLRTWLCRYDVQSADTDDLTQEVLFAVA
jgi:hypothetical protein